MVKELCRVVIVDDEVLIRQGIKHYLDWEQEGFTIVGEASNGEEALQLIEETSPHIVITDVVMPIMDGLQLTEKIKESYEEIAVIILSSFSDFDYVRSTFQNGVADYILKPKLDAKELLRALKQAVQRIPNFEAIGRSKRETSIEDSIQSILETGESMGTLSLIESHFCLIGVNAKGNIDDRLLNVLTGYKYYEIGSAKKDWRTYFINLAEADFKDLLQQLKKIAEASKKEDYKTILVVGSLLEDLALLKSSYEAEFQPIKNLQFYFPEKTFLTWLDLVGLSEDSASFDLNYFSNSFKRQDFIGAFDYLDEYIQKCATQITLSEQEFKSKVENMIFNITILLDNLAFQDSLHDEKYAYFQLVNEAENVKEVFEHLNVFKERVRTVISSQQIEPVQTNMKKMLAYIDQFYDESISLKVLANHFHFNPSYLSTYFRNHYGMGLNEYLTQVRIEKAKEHLRNYKVPISEVGHLVGYPDHSYFCKVFKKVTGMSPSKYRKSTFV